MARNIVLIILDTVRKDYFDKYAKRILELSDTSFTQCRAASSWSVPSHASMFTGQLPHQHDIHSESFDASFDFGQQLENETFLSDLSGYDTIGISSNLYVNKRFGFDSIFDDFIDHSIGTHYTAVPFPEVANDFSTNTDSWLKKQIEGIKIAISSDNPLKSLCNGVWYTFGDQIEKAPLPRVSDNGAKANAKSVRKFADNSEEPFFAFVNFMDAHNPLQNSLVYDQNLHSVSNFWSSNKYKKWELLVENCADKEYTNNYRELYGAAIDYLDRIVSKLIIDIESGIDNETTIIITADHGHNLGYNCEEGLFHHTASLSEGILHVPLEIINPPSRWPDSVSQIFSHIEIYDIIELIRDEEWDEKRICQDPVVAENIGLLGEDDKVNYDSNQEVDQKYWNRMIRCGYEDTAKFEWDSTNTCRKYRLDRQNSCWQSLIETDCEIPDHFLNIFDKDIFSYKSKWKGSNQDLSFDSNVEENLKDLGYL